MSDWICPDCHGFAIERLEKEDHCTLCNWYGSHLPFEEVTEEAYNSLWEQYEDRKNAKEQGNLFFMRIYGESKDSLETMRDHMLKLDLLRFKTKYELQNFNRHYILIFFEDKPRQDYIEKVKNVAFVADIEIV